ncbi:MAG: hypothetical protein AAFY71_07095 [Bacteroidota bacterium]
MFIPFSNIKFLVGLLFFVTGIGVSHAQYYGMATEVEETWAIGIRVGTGWVQGDIAANIPSFDGGIYAQKFLQRGLDLRFGVNIGQYSGQDFTPSTGFEMNPVLNGGADTVNFYSQGSAFFQNYRMQWMDGFLQLKLNFNRLFTQYGNENWDLYGLAGIGGVFYQTYMDAFDANGRPYEYSGLVTDVSERPEVLEALAIIQDGEFETRAERDFINSTNYRGFVVNTQWLTGVGVRFPITGILSLGLQADYIFMGDDLLDGQQWTNESNGTTPTATSSNDRMIRIGLHIDAKF